MKKLLYTLILMLLIQLPVSARPPDEKYRELERRVTRLETRLRNYKADEFRCPDADNQPMNGHPYQVTFYITDGGFECEPLRRR